MRKKLFSGNPSTNSRRKLFSDESAEPVGNSVIVCMDCKTAYVRDNASTTNFICPNCGGNRFEVAKNIQNQAIPQVSGSIIDSRSFSSTNRRKLFNDQSSLGGSNGPTINDEGREKLVNQVGSSLTKVVNDPKSDHAMFTCPDCGHQFTTSGRESVAVICPNCGGTRCRETILNQVEDQDSDDKLDDLMKGLNGKSISKSSLTKLMSEHGIYGDPKLFSDAGYATISDDGVTYKFSDTAYQDRKLFSKIVISVTKEFDIDPNIDRESAIESLANGGRLPDKSIMILRRINKTPEEISFSDVDYLKDSGIANDLSTEYGGSSIPLKEFMNILSSEYNDAPDNLLDLLVDNKVIRINGSQVQVNKSK